MAKRPKHVKTQFLQPSADRFGTPTDVETEADSRSRELEMKKPELHDIEDPPLASDTSHDIFDEIVLITVKPLVWVQVSSETIAATRAAQVGVVQQVDSERGSAVVYFNALAITATIALKQLNEWLN